MIRAISPIAPCLVTGRLVSSPSQFGRRGNPLRVRLLSRGRFSTSREPAPSGKSSRRRGGGGENHVPPYVIFGFAAPAAGVAAASIYGYYRCLDDVPYTKRRRFIATSPQWEEKMGHEQFNALLKQFEGEILPSDHRASVTVRRVGSRIVAAAQKCSMEWSHPNQNVATRRIPPYTYTVVRSPEANAFVLPGNHVFVLTGLFRYAHNEDELASVLGHEMAHNLARHAGERASEGLLLGIAGRLALLVDPSGVLFSVLVPAQTLLLSLPHSREHEVEADRIGLMLASEACYDPRAAKRVFSRMKVDADDGGGGRSPPPEFMSTHPGYDTRLSLFDQWMPDALGRFHADGGSKCRRIRGEMKRARRLAAEMQHEKDSRVDTRLPLGVSSVGLPPN